MNINTIENSFTNKFSRTIRRKTIKAINEFKMIENGDKIAVCISGGKDSFILAKILQHYQKHSEKNFSLIFLAMDGGYSQQVRQHIEQNAQKLNINLEFFNTDVLQVIKKYSEKHPCFLCSKMRRGYLYKEAQLRGCNKIALGHHYDDAIETVLMSVIYGGQVQSMLPRLKSKNYQGMELIRPLYFVRESDIIEWSEFAKLSFLPCGCPASENKENTKREQIKQLIKSLAHSNKQIEANILNSVKNIDVEKVIGWRIGKGEKHSFLDNF